MPILKLSIDWSTEEVENFCGDILTIAAEGGINYWASFNTERRTDLTVLTLSNMMDVEDEDQFDDVDIEDIWSTLQKVCDGVYDNSVANRILDDIQDDLATKECCQIDAEGADVIVQLALFDEVVYG